MLKLIKDHFFINVWLNAQSVHPEKQVENVLSILYFITSSFINVYVNVNETRFLIIDYCSVECIIDSY